MPMPIDDKTMTKEKEFDELEILTTAMIIISNTIEPLLREPTWVRDLGYPRLYHAKQYLINQYNEYLESDK